MYKFCEYFPYLLVMGGGLIQLVAQGIQDLYLSGDPQITFFKVVYRRHTNFAVESIPQYFSSPADFGQTVSCTLSKTGDLLGPTILYVELPAIPKFIDTDQPDNIKKMAWVKNLGYALVRDISIEIGGNPIDKHYGEWLYIWSQVNGKQGHALDKMLGNIREVYEFTNGKEGCKLYIPLEFWFCRHTGLSLPLTALTSMDVKIIVSFQRLEDCYRLGPTHSIVVNEDVVPFESGDYIEQNVDGPIYGYVMGFDYLQKRLYYIKIRPTRGGAFSGPNDGSNGKLYDSYRIFSRNGAYCTPKIGAKEEVEQTQFSYTPHIISSYLYTNYVYLDNDERMKFVKNNNEYLIEQLQFNQEISIKSPNVKQNLSLNHPCKSHYWVAQLDSLVGPGTINDRFNYTESHVPDSPNLLKQSKLMLNGVERFNGRAEHFNLLEPYKYHSGGPVNGIHAFLFSVYPENNQPSSSANMTKIDSIHMVHGMAKNMGVYDTAKIRSYTVNYNILRVCFGMCLLGFG